MSNTPLFIRVNECKDYFGFDKRTIYRWAKDGLVNIYKHGNISLLNVAEVTSFIKNDCGTN